jgi:hypothetical protein
MGERIEVTEMVGTAQVHFPKLLLHPVPQWPVVVPQYPNCEQHVPKVEPAHVKPLFPAQVPSVETFLVGAAEVAAALAVEAAAVPGHVPKDALHPAAQWSAVLPHQPYWLQHEPKVEPEQVKPVVPPHEPSVETLPVAFVADGEGAALVVEVGLGTTPFEPQLPKPDWHPVPQYAEVVPQ